MAMLPADAYHAHLDVCEHCREHPFALCAVGDVLLRGVEVALSALADMRRAPSRAAHEKCEICGDPATQWDYDQFKRLCDRHVEQEADFTIPLSACPPLNTTALAARVETLEAAILEATRHMFGKCDCPEKYPPGDVSCSHFAETALAPFVEVGPPPAYEHRLRAAEKEKG